MSYKKLRYSSRREAEKTQRKMQKLYGYKPEIFKETDRFIIVKPKGLKKIKW